MSEDSNIRYCSVIWLQQHISNTANKWYIKKKEKNGKKYCEGSIKCSSNRVSVLFRMRTLYKKLSISLFFVSKHCLKYKLRAVFASAECWWSVPTSVFANLEIIFFKPCLCLKIRKYSLFFFPKLCELLICHAYLNCLFSSDQL